LIINFIVRHHLNDTNLKNNKQVEAEHEKRFLSQLKKLENMDVFKP